MTATTRLFLLLLLLTALPLAAALGLVLVEGWSFFDALYMAVITLTTVGYEEVHPLSTPGRVLIIVYLVFGLGAFLYGVTHVGELLIRGELRQRLGWRLMNATIRSLADHQIICGCGRTGSKLGALLAERGERFVVVDWDPEALAGATERGWPVLVGDATDDATLRALHVERAKGLAAVLSSDADNLFVVLSARLLNRNLNILSRATKEESIGKLERAGADQVVSLHQIGATKMAHLLTNPGLVDFTEGARHGEGEGGRGADGHRSRLSALQPDARRLGLPLAGGDGRRDPEEGRGVPLPPRRRDPRPPRGHADRARARRGARAGARRRVGAAGARLAGPPPPRVASPVR